MLRIALIIVSLSIYGLVPRPLLSQDFSTTPNGSGFAPQSDMGEYADANLATSDEGLVFSGTEGCVTDQCEAVQMQCEDCTYEEPWVFSAPATDAYDVRRWRPTLHFETDLVALTMDVDDNFALPTNIVGESLSSGGFAPRFDAGSACRLGYLMKPGLVLEAGWLGDVSTAGRHSESIVGGVSTLNRSGSFAQYDIMLGHEIDSRYEMRFLPNNMIGFAGVRGIQFDGGISSFASTNVENRLVGAVGGFRSHTTHARSSTTQFDLLAGVFNNDATIRVVGGTSGTESLASGSERRRGTAFAGQLSFKYQYWLKKEFSFSVGYQVHLISGLALADRNFGTNLNAAAPTIDMDGDAILHGPNFGIVWTR